MSDKQCKALKLNKKQCARPVRNDSEYCWQHGYSRSGDDVCWYNNAKIQAKIGLAGLIITTAALLFSLCVWISGPSKEEKEERAKIDKMYQAFDLNPEIKEAVENIFLQTLQEKDVPEWQWPEKLQEIANSHQDLLDKWQRFESVDPQVDKLREQAYAAILKGYYDKADSLFEQAVEIDDKAIAAQEENLGKRKVSKSQSLAAQANLAKTRVDYSKAIELYEQALDVLPTSNETIQATYLNNLGLLYKTTAQYEKAELKHKRVVEILENPGGEPLPNYAEALNNLGACRRTPWAQSLNKTA